MTRIKRPPSLSARLRTRYFELLDGLLASLEDAALPPSWQICAFDLGLTPSQRANVQSRGVRMLDPQWSLDFPGRSEAPGWLRAMVNRPFLTDFFPGFQTYIWIDCDAWVQQPDCLREMIQAASDGRIAVAIERFGPPRTYRFTTPDGQLRGFSVSEQSCRKNIEDCYRRCFGPDTAMYAHQQVVGSGIFALRGDSPVWKAWRESLALGLRNTWHVLVEQQALNLAIHQGRVSICPIHSRCNWNMTTQLPLVDLSRGLYVDPANPAIALGIIHLIELKQLSAVTLPTTTGQSIQAPLAYRDFAARFKSTSAR